MLDEKKRPLHAHPSLLPLRMALIASERESPARPRRVDVNERLAVQLIARMQSRYKRVHPFVTLLDDNRENTREMAGSHVR